MTPDVFLLFTFEAYSGSGGWEDFSGCFETLESAKFYADHEDLSCTNAHVVSFNNKKIVSRAVYDNTLLKFRWQDL